MRTVFYQNVVWRVCFEIDECKRELEIYYHNQGERLVITSANDGQHGIGSLHNLFIGRAFDHEITEKVKEAHIRGVLKTVEEKLRRYDSKYSKFNKLFDLVPEKDRGVYHIEYDPK